jgi:REP element-mobilizing transposase RayT
MADLFKGKYRIPSARCPNWDYSSNGAYFITICTDKRIHFFGSIKYQKSLLTEAGQIAERLWAEIPLHFPFIQLDAFVVMPNHIHGILIININDQHGDYKRIKKVSDQNQPEELPNDENRTVLMSLISPKTGSVASIIRSYKSACSNQINKIDPSLNFKWQARYHDHIIRNHQSFCRIRQYIINNPSKWNDDIFHR